MRRITVWGAGLLAALAALAPGGAFASGVGENGEGGPDYAPPATWLNLPVPLYSTHPDLGGPFVFGGFALYRQTNPLTDQPVAYRGFIVTDPVTTQADLVTPANFFVPQGTFLGNRTVALDVHQVTGPGTYEPGFTIGVGWKCQDGPAVTLSWLWLASAQFRADATLINRPDQILGGSLANSFLTSFVYNFPSQYGGPFAKVTLAPLSNPTGLAVPVGGVFGIWNGASVETEKFEQRASQIDLCYRVPFYETECYRVSGLVGPRFFWIWERFTWNTTDIGLDAAGNTLPDQPTFSALYTNVVSNRMYGVNCGFCQEYYCGCGFACMLESEACLYLDIVKEQAKYQFPNDQIPPQNKRRITQYRVVPEFQLTPRIMWYPWEGIQMSLGYDLMAFFNTIAAPRPIDFNYSALDPPYVSTHRFFDGIQANIALLF
jgi:hypothetical protein